MIKNVSASHGYGKASLQSGETQPPQGERFFVGQIVQATVLKSFSSMGALILIKGRGVLARTRVPLQEGACVSLQLKKMLPAPTFKLLETFPNVRVKPNPSATVSVTKENIWADLLAKLEDAGNLNSREKQFVRLLNQFPQHMYLEKHPEQRKIFLPVSMHFANGTFLTGQLLIHEKHRDDGESASVEHRPVRITFLLELSRLGPLRVELLIRGKSICGTFLTENESSRRILEEHVQSLVQKLTDSSFAVTQIVCRRTDFEKFQDPLVNEMFSAESCNICLVA